MQRIARLSGFIAAHAIWCVSDDGPLVPMVGFERSDGSRGLTRFAAERLEEGVAQARAWLVENPEEAVAAVAAFDGYVPLSAGKTDAILLEGRLYLSDVVCFEMAVPYRPASEDSQFAVFRPKFTKVDLPSPDYGALGNEFFAGVDSHEKGAEVWNAHIDQAQ